MTCSPEQSIIGEPLGMDAATAVGNIMPSAIAKTAARYATVLNTDQLSTDDLSTLGLI